MSLDHSAHILTTHDLGNLRILQQHHHPQQLHQQHNLTTVATSNAGTTTSKALFGGSLKNLSSNSNMILSTIPLDGRALIIPTISNGNSHQHQPQQQQQQTLAQQQPQRYTVTSNTGANGFRNISASTTTLSSGTATTASATSAIANNNNISNLLAAAGVTTKATILNANINNNKNNNNTIISTSNSNTMPTTSKYVFVQQNSNGQYTTYEGSATTATPTGNGGTNVGNIVLLATEPLNGNGNEQPHVITTTTTTTGTDNDEELRPLAWLSDSNLIKGIVTTSGSNGNIVTTVGGNNVKRQGNICIVNANNTHDLIEELPTHVAGEENVITTTTHAADAGSSSQITTLSVSDFQQQFITSNKRFTPITVSGGSGSGSNSQLSTLANFTLAQDANNTATAREATQHVYGNIAALGATTSVHVGPSGTTTVVEYKTTNGNFIPTQRQLINGNSVVVGTAASNSSNNNAANTTITATNLSNNSNTNVPSSSSAAGAGASTIQKTLMALPNATTLLTTTNNASQQQQQVHQTVVNSNGTTNTIYQGQKQHISSSNSNTTTSTTSSTTTTTHHPHKKYLREKMNVLDHGGGGGGGASNINTINNNNVAIALVVSSAPNVISTQNTVPSSAITVVASPASSLSSQSSSSTSSSTAAVNGGNSPVSKSFFGLSGNGNGATAIAVNYASSSPSPLSSAPLATSIGNSGGLPASYTIVSQANQQTISSSPVIVSSPEPPQNTKDYYTLTSVSQSNNQHHNQQRYHHTTQNSHNQHSHNHNQQHQQQNHHHQQQQHQHNSMRSPISHSSYDNDSLKDFEISPNDSTTNSMGGTRLSAASTPQHHSNSQSYHQSSAGKTGSSHIIGQGNTTPQKQKHPNNVPYDPLVHTHNKPPYSFSSLIFMAIEGSHEKALPVKEIYAWIVQHFPYFKTAPTGWKNSVRHNLSLNKSFVKVEKAPNMGKGSLWRVEQQQRQNLIQALTRSPFFPNSAVDKIGLKSANSVNNIGQSLANNNASYDVIDGAISPPPQASPITQTTATTTPNSKSQLNSRFDPQLFPNLSKTFKDMSDPNGALSDVPDDEYPSDYSTTNHNNNNNNNNNISNHNNNKSHSNNISNNNNNNSKYNNYAGNDVVDSSGNNNNCNGGNVMMGAFSNYESIERLARDCGAENIDDVHAATAMLALKHGPKVFAETFQNGAPVITSSPSEDHTYSAGNNSAANSGASTPLMNGNANSIVLNGHGNATTNGNKQNGCDNQSNCASSDAAYESSEESHNITPEELEDQKRYRDGVDALLSLSIASSVVDSTSSSPNKRPASTTVEEEHLSASIESSNSVVSNSSPPQHNMGKMSILTNSTTFATRQHHQQQQQQQQQQQSQYNLNNNNSSGNNNKSNNILDEGYNTQGYYGSNNANANANGQNPHQHHHHHYNTQQHHITMLGSPSTAKKVKTSSRNLRTKIKRKVPWMR